MEVGNGVEFERRLLGAERAVEIAAKTDGAGVADELAVAINVLDEFFEVEIGRLRRGFTAFPARDIIHASRQTPTTAPRAERARNMSSASWRWCGTRVRELW